MNAKAFLVMIFAVASSYLIITMPAAFATQVSISYGGFPPVEASMPSYVNREIAAVTDDPFKINYNLQIDLTAASESSLEGVYMYKCKGLNPTDCITSVSPDFYEFVNNSVNLELPWQEFTDKTYGYPQTGNILFLVKVNTPGKTWVSYWHKIVRSSSSFTPPYHFTYDIDTVELDASSLDFVQQIKTFVENNGMIPFNWINFARFIGAGMLYEIRAENPPSFQTDVYSGNQISSLAKEYSIIFPEVVDVENGITLNLNPSYMCPGDGDNDGDDCDSSLGENSANCCYDCGCPGGQYCDVGLGCNPFSSVYLEVIPPTNTVVSNCNVENTVRVTLRLNDRPSDLSITGQSYILNGSGSKPFSCPEGPSSIYTCDIIVPADPNCDEGSFLLTDNSITFDVEYSDGPDMLSLSYEIGFPDIEVGSWVCGDFSCDSILGETQSNCCYDCGCSSGFYCDISSGADPNTGSCSLELNENNINIMNLYPSVFSHYSQGGETAAFDLQITNKPRSLSINSFDCASSCVFDSDVCSSSCSISCSEEVSTDPEVYNSTCEVLFTISNYNKEYGYSITPNLTLSMNYKNGSSVINQQLSKGFGPVVIGPHWCGDGVCNVDESFSSCCYDCGCPEEEFCNTVDPNKPSEGDVCIEDKMDLVIDNITNTVFVDQNLQHKLNITARVTSIPNGFSPYAYSCELWGDKIPCNLQCSPLGQGVDYEFECEIYVPKITYKNATKIVIEPNELKINFGFNNGSEVETKYLSAYFDDIIIEQIYHCGFDGCETYLGEDVDNCCIDCPCIDKYGDDYVCVPGGTNPDSSCIPKSSIVLAFNEVEPSPVECEIMPRSHGGGCSFFGKTANVFTFTVTNPPADLELVNARYKYEGETVDVGCYENKSIGVGVYECPLIFQNIPDPGGGVFSGLEPKKEKKSIIFYFDMSYTNNNILLYQNLSTSGKFDMKWVKSETLTSCEEQRANRESRISHFEGRESLVQGIMAAILGIVIVFCGLCGFEIGCGFCCWVCHVGVSYLLPCGFGLMLPLLGNIKASLKQYDNELDTICPENSVSDLSDSITEMDTMMYQMGGMILTTICLYSAFNGGLDVKEGWIQNLFTGSGEAAGGIYVNPVQGLVPTTAPATPNSNYWAKTLTESLQGPPG
jgi:hypothetical protein